MMTTPIASGAAGPGEREPRTNAPFASFDVPFELARVRAERGYEVEGHAGRTLAKLPDLRAVLEAMKAGVRLPLHETPERVTLQVLLGQLRLWLEHGENRDLAEGSFVAVEAGHIHEIECLEDCAFLLTLAWPAERRAAEGDGARSAEGTSLRRG